jgi:hypothetical protein
VGCRPRTAAPKAPSRRAACRIGSVENRLWGLCEHERTRPSPALKCQRIFHPALPRLSRYGSLIHQSALEDNLARLASLMPPTATAGGIDWGRG